MFGSQWPWNHLPWKYPPKPIEPAASVYSSRFWAGVGVDSRKKERPFHLERNIFHMARSLKNSLFSLTWWKRLGTPLVKLIARCRKVLPGTTTLHAYWRVPISDCNSTRRTNRRFLKESSSWLILMSLSWGKRASMRTLSKIIPINSISREGPIVLEATTRVLSDMNTLNRVLKLVKQSNLFPCSAIRKLSRMWITCWMP